ncbi:MAG TPA: type I DNA topoisomerase [Gemmatimonadaceae bacterium]|jgi:DNA topoisomerase-1|nr:type I DNA topoisomerase [Gemmatimonadaceae bacterium]
MAKAKTATAKTTAKRASKSASKTTKATRARKTVAESNGDHPSEPGSTSLVIVESPAKAKTIGKYLGRAYKVRATIGHVRDLPQKKMGIDIENGFQPEYVTIPGKEKTVAELKSAARDSREIFLATDPDREGEAIAWHVAQQIKSRNGAPVRRVLFHEITRDAVQSAIQNAGDIDERKVEAQQARRVLDRLVGYKASPVLWKTVKKGISAGRVQTVALRLLVEREREIRAFKAVEYWTVEALLEENGQQFTAKLHLLDGKKPVINNEREANAILDALKPRKTFQVSEVKRRERRKNPAAPFTTSTLQQDAAKKLGFGSKRTMRLAQDLYEGIEIGKDEGSVGLITYMRTDSTRVAPSAAMQARDYIKMMYGKEYLPDAPRLYADSKSKNAQDAHEAIRPTDPTRRPEHIRKFLKEDQFKLYELIWQRFMASQMTPAVFDTTTIDFEFDRFLFRATGSVMKFDGYQKLYKESREAEEGKPLEAEQGLPPVERGEEIPVKSITPSQHFTEPPPRYSEASLVKELERLGIGRPSTYASIVSTLVDRRYAMLEQRRFFPTQLGEQVEKVMVKSFPDVFNVRFTSHMESDLDKVEEGDVNWRKMLKDFYGPFAESVKAADIEALIGEAHDLSAIEKERCPDCGGKLVPRGGFFGPFLACENHPKECKYTRPLRGDRKPAQPTNEICHECGAPMVIRHGRSGEFLGCSKFPKCRGTRSMPTGVKCPKDGGDIAVRRSKKRGKAFYGCSNYPNCDFVVWDKPVAETCPECGYVGAEAKFTKTRGDYRRCIKCANEWDVAPSPEPEAVAV